MIVGKRMAFVAAVDILFPLDWTLLLWRMRIKDKS